MVPSSLPPRPIRRLWTWWALGRLWVALIGETLFRRRLSQIVRWALAGQTLVVRGVEAVPTAGPFVLAVNHLQAGSTLGVMAATLGAAARARPGVDDACLLVVGERVAPVARARNRQRRLALWIADRIFGRWIRNVVRIPMGNDAPVLTALRAFRRRATEQPVLVFPEGLASREFGQVRPGSGRWLSGLGAPTLPVAVARVEGGWEVAFGPPMVWSRRAELRDLQLGLAIADMLPPRLAPTWQEELRRWHETHANARQDPSSPSPAEGVGKGARRHSVSHEFRDIAVDV